MINIKPHSIIRTCYICGGVFAVNNAKAANATINFSKPVEIDDDMFMDIQICPICTKNILSHIKAIKPTRIKFAK